MFKLDDRLGNDTHFVGEWSLSLLLLHVDSNFPWCILVPKREQVCEIFELKEEDQLGLLDESRLLATALMEIFRPDKLNVAALGNMVKQLHVHHIARYQDDVAWPAPVWGAVSFKEYEADALKLRISSLRKVLRPTGLSW